MLRLRGVVFISCLLSVFSHASVMANNQGVTDIRIAQFWKSACNSEHETLSTMCSAYAQGVGEGIQTQSEYLNTPEPYCMPSEVTVVQRRDVFTKYLNDNPQVLYVWASIAFMEAMINAFPCTTD